MRFEQPDTKMKVILDTNIWISFLIGHLSLFMRRLLTDARFDVWVCRELILEIKSVASRDKIRKYVSESDIIDLLTIIHAFCKSAPITSEIQQEAVRDPKDLYLLAFAETIEADFIISGDADLASLENYQRTKIMRIADFKEMMQL